MPSVSRRILCPDRPAAGKRHNGSTLGPYPAIGGFSPALRSPWLGEGNFDIPSVLFSEEERWKFDLGLPDRQISKSTQATRSTIAEYLRRFAESGIAWPLPSDLADATLEARLFPPKPALPDALRPVPDWPLTHQEMRKKGVTLFLLWQEYKTCHPDGFRYSWFCHHYRAWAGRLDAVMRQEHRAGEKCFVDYAGQTIPVTDRHTGEIRQTQIFVGVMGASNYTFAEATWSQSLPDWIGNHTRMLDYFGAAPEILVPDNLPGSERQRQSRDAVPAHSAAEHRVNRRPIAAARLSRKISIGNFLSVVLGAVRAPANGIVVAQPPTHEPAAAGRSDSPSPTPSSPPRPE